MQGGDRLVVDPHLKEEASASGSVSVVMNNGHELCCMDKQGGLGLSMPQVQPAAVLTLPPAAARLVSAAIWCSC